MLQETFRFLLILSVVSPVSVVVAVHDRLFEVYHAVRVTAVKDPS